MVDQPSPGVSSRSAPNTAVKSVISSKSATDTSFGYLNEAKRVLQPGGAMVLNSPNRFSLVAPEPHVGLWGLGFLPRAWMNPVCKMLGKGGYTGKRLLSLPELRRLLREMFANYRIVSRKSNPDARSLAGKVFHLTSPLSERAFAHISGLHDVVAVKES